MGEMVNLRQVRKAKQRTAAAEAAAENRARHGLPKAEKLKIAKEKDRAEAHLDGHKKD